MDFDENLCGKSLKCYVILFYRNLLEFKLFLHLFNS